MSASPHGSRPVMIELSNGVEFEDPEERIREYCKVEVYRDINYRGGYDDHHNITNSVTNDDLEAANNLYANLDGLDRRRILGNPAIPHRLIPLKDVELGNTTDAEWDEMMALIRPLLAAFLSIPNIKLAKTMKILHLKRPHLFPVLDSFVVKFLTGNDTASNPFSEEELLKIGVSSLQIARADLTRNAGAFEELRSRLADLPTPLTRVRMFDILCRTQEKWVNRANPKGKYGAASKSLDDGGRSMVPRRGAPLQEADKSPPHGEIKSIKEFRQIKLRAEGVIVNTASSPPRAHRPLCVELTEERFQNAVIFGEGKGGKYYLRNNLAEAVKDLGAVACKKCKPERPVRPT